VLDRISERIQGFDPDHARSLLADAGIGDNMARLLRQRNPVSADGLGEKYSEKAHVFRSLASINLVRSLVETAGSTVDGLVALLKNASGDNQQIAGRAAGVQTRGLENLAGWNQGAGSQPAEAPVDGFASDDRVRSILAAMTEPTRLIFTLFGNAYEIPTGADGANRGLMENVKEAFGKWEKIDPEHYASAMVDYLKAQALLVAVDATAPSMGTAPLANVNVTQYIDSVDDARDVARRITDEIEAAGRQFPAASY
jgi:hypothetical protein